MQFVRLELQISCSTSRAMPAFPIVNRATMPEFSHGAKKLARIQLRHRTIDLHQFLGSNVHEFVFQHSPHCRTVQIKNVFPKKPKRSLENRPGEGSSITSTSKIISDGLTGSDSRMQTISRTDFQPSFRMLPFVMRPAQSAVSVYSFSA